LTRSTLPTPSPNDEELVTAAIFANNNEEHAVANTLANHAEELDAAIAFVATRTYVNVGPAQEQRERLDRQEIPDKTAVKTRQKIMSKAYHQLG
jgi:hypothetical protein